MANHSDHGEVLDLILRGVDGINERLDAQNGRVRKAEVAIARLQWAVFIGGAGVIGGLWWLFQMHVAK